MIACEKEYTINVAGVRLDGYWTFDEAVGNGPHLDKVHAMNLPGAAGAQVAAGLYGNAWKFRAVVGNSGVLGSPVFPQLAQSTTTKGISYWFWYRLDVASTNASFTAEWKFFFFDTVLLQQMVMDIEISDSNNQAQVSLFDTSANLFTASTGNGGFTPLVGVWSMLCAVWDRAAATLTLYINGVSVVSVAANADLIALDSAKMQGSFFSSFGVDGWIADFDEMGICVNGAITQAQVTALYNGGLGVTWPQASTIVPV